MAPNTLGHLGEPLSVANIPTDIESAEASGLVTTNREIEIRSFSGSGVGFARSWGDDKVDKSVGPIQAPPGCLKREPFNTPEVDPTPWLLLERLRLNRVLGCNGLFKCLHSFEGLPIYTQLHAGFHRRRHIVRMLPQQLLLAVARSANLQLAAPQLFVKIPAFLIFIDLNFNHHTVCIVDNGDEVYEEVKPKQKTMM